MNAMAQLKKNDIRFLFPNEIIAKPAEKHCITKPRASLPQKTHTKVVTTRNELIIVVQTYMHFIAKFVTAIGLGNQFS